jgi:hypothetical protein
MDSNPFQRLVNILRFPKNNLFARFEFLDFWELSFEVAAI